WTNAAARDAREESANQAAELNNQAVVRAKDHHYEEAIAVLKKAIALRPDLPMAYYNLGRIYQMIDQWELAIDAFKHALAVQPEFVDAIHQLAVSYNSTERYADAMECSQRALQLQPGRVDSLTELGFAYSKQ